MKTSRIMVHMLEQEVICEDFSSIVSDSFNIYSIYIYILKVFCDVVRVRARVNGIRFPQSVTHTDVSHKYNRL